MHWLTLGDTSFRPRKAGVPVRRPTTSCGPPVGLGGPHFNVGSFPSTGMGWHQTRKKTGKWAPECQIKLPPVDI